MGCRNKIKTSIIVFFFISISAAFSQLKVSNITNLDLLQNTVFHTNSSSSNRTESVADSVLPTVFIKIISGNNPRCDSDNQTVLFSATGTNLGNAPQYKWYVNNVLSNINTSTFGQNNFASSDIIVCEIVSNLDCASPKSVFSKAQTISVVTSITPSVNITVKTGNNPDCNGNSPILLEANVTNGGQNPQYIWAKNTNIITTAVGNTLYLDSLGNKAFVNVTVLSNIGNCLVTSSLLGFSSFKRTVQTSIVQPSSNAVDITLLSVLNDNCEEKKYTFKATATHPGLQPMYVWYFNNVPTSTVLGNVFTNPGNTFELKMPLIGDEIKVKVRSSLACVDTKEVFSSNFIRIDTIKKLPFFEDFSTYQGQPDSKKWLKKEGTYIANNYTFNPPSAGVAYFDGLKYNGNPYDSVNITSRGAADRLTSLPINLSSFLPNDSLYLHFFWTVKGLGEEPDSTQGDNLSVFFKDSNNFYTQQWTIRKYVDSNKTKFAHASIKISSSLGANFLHRGFQFRFQTTGRLSGLFDIWGVDYIYIGKKSSEKRPFFNDQTFGASPGRMLKNYTSMPYKHFISNIDNELRDTVAATTINNFADEPGNVNLINFDIFDNTTNISLGNVQSVFTNSKLYPVTNKINILKSSTIFPLIAPRNPYILNATFNLRNDVDNSDFKQIPYTQNNTLSYPTRFDNYYAYDDGSAESIISRNVKYGYVAQKFTTNKQDTLRQIAIHWNKSKKALNNSPISIMVWKNLPKLTNPNPKDADILYKNTHLLRYANIVDGFSVIELDTKDNPLVVINGDFHIGYQQISDEEVIVGFDKNNSYATSNLYYSNNGQWVDFATTSPESKGSMMMRPVFGTYTDLPLPIVNKEKSNISDFIIYPNPADDKIILSSAPQKVEVMNSIGSNIFTLYDTEKIETSALVDGIYILKIWINNTVLIKKITVFHTK